VPLSDQLDKLAAVAKVLPLRYWDDPVLSTVCDKIEDNEFGEKLAEFGRELIATMNAKNGVGLAAPQVGVAKRMFAMLFPDHEDTQPIVVCNPKLVLTGATVAAREGCLSLPNVYEQVYRSECVTMQFSDPLGKSYETLLCTPFDARVAQHEADHLDGIMFFDYRDKRENYVTEQFPKPRGARMSKQLSKSVLREWEKIKKQRGF
jgi:peptide deformylase